MFRTFLKSVGLLFVTTAVATPLAAATAYNPLDVATSTTASAPVDLVVHDTARQRDIPILVYLPSATDPAPVLLFSHGLGGSRSGSGYLGLHWAARGYTTVYVQHPGSDTGVWQNTPRMQRMSAMRDAASLENFMLRVNDIPAVLNQLEVWNADPKHHLYHRLDLQRVGMSGHSFGAITTQAVSGQSFPLVGTRYTDKRIKAAIALSPSAPTQGNATAAFGKVSIPWLLMTGTQDVAAIGGATLESRRAVFPALPAGQKYELVLKDAEHSAFTDTPLPGDKERRNPNHHRAVLAISTAFWDSVLRNDSAATQWLQGQGPRSILDPADLWAMK